MYAQVMQWDVETDLEFVYKAGTHVSPVFFAKASLIVMKFFRDFDILQPEIVRCPVCRKYRTQ